MAYCFLTYNTKYYEQISISNRIIIIIIMQE